MLSPNAVDKTESEIKDTSLLRSQIAILEREVMFKRAGHGFNPVKRLARVIR